MFDFLWERPEGQIVNRGGEVGGVLTGDREAKGAAVVLPITGDIQAVAVPMDVTKKNIFQSVASVPGDVAPCFLVGCIYAILNP